MSYSFDNFTAPVTTNSGDSGETNSIATNSSQSNPPTTTRGSDRPENQGASIPAAFFDLLKKMEPPDLRASPESVGWERLVEDLHEMYKGYLTTMDYNVGQYKSMTNDTQYFGRRFSASFGQPDNEGRFVTLTFTLNTDGSYAGSDGVRQALHRTDDERFLDHRIFDTGRNGDALGRFP